MACVWGWDQSTGELLYPNGVMIAHGYSGGDCGRRPDGVNNPELEQVADVGPIPVGEYAVGAFFDDLGGKGPMVCRLTPVNGTETYGRSGFMIHGDNAAMNQSASEGCVILPKVVREAIAASGEALLRVTR